MRKKLILTLVISLFWYLSLTGLVFDKAVEFPRISNDRFELELPVIMEPGSPMLAYYELRILLPEGHKFTGADFSFQNEQESENIYLHFATEPQPISQPSFSETLPNMDIYRSDSFYPRRRYEILGTERKNGHDLLLINVYPYSYNPVRQRLNWYSSYRLVINTEYDQQTAEEQNLFLTQTERVRNELSTLVMNPEEMSSYSKKYVRTESILPDINNPYKMIIISDESKETLFNDYIDWKESNGISTGFFSVNEIYQNYPGVNNQEKIRNLIIDAYQTYAQTDTPLEYVILGGDDRIIPIRGMYGEVGQYVDYNMPSDVYYSNLDGTWDANGNGIYGEMADNPDWFAEVALGRIPAFTDSQFLNSFHKSYHYVDNATFSNDIVYMFGENLDYQPTWGGDYKDVIIPYIPSEYYLDTLYERDGTFSIANVMNAINNGVGIINHIGHANFSIVFGLNNIRIGALTNTDYGFAYTQGCYPAAFDTPTSQESGCVGQNLVTTSGGLFAFIGNTRYGWYSPGNTNGASQAYDITFFSGLYEQNIRELGYTMNYSKEQLVNQAMSSGVMRWVYYQLILFGDPSIAVKDANGNFPYIEPVSVVFDDVAGDNDGIVNPGETIHIYIELANQPNWSDASEVTAVISFDNNSFNLINDSVNYGSLAQSTTGTNTSNPFIVSIDENVPYGNHVMQVHVTAVGEGNTTFTNIYELPVSVTLIQKDWPWNSSYPISASPLYLDFTGDDLEELVVVDALGNITLLDSSAEELQETINNQENLWRSFSVGDINNSGNKEIVIASRTGKILVIDQQGDLLFSYDECGQQILTPVLSDLNNDGSLQIISLGLDKNLYVLNSLGELSEGYPVQLPHTSIADLAVADLNDDGYNEIIIGSLDGNLYALNYNGTFLDGFPVSLGSGVISAPIVLDNKNIAVGTTNNKLFLVSPEGEIVFEKTLSNRISTEIIAADFLNDGELELAFITNNGTAHLLNQNGEYLDGWPQSFNELFSQPPLAVDLNNDGFVNFIAYSSGGRVYALHNDGSSVDSFPVPLNTSLTAPALIADIDNDGDWDIILTTSAGVTVVDYKGAKGSNTPWLLYRGNTYRTGFYGDNTTTNSDIPVSDYTTAMKQNYPNPFNPDTRIDFSLKEDASVVLEVFNIKGQRVTTLVNEDLPAGNHSVVWRGTNSENRSVASGIYFYRLVSPEKTITKKMLLVK
jgi:hypothetical protein